MCGAAGSRRQPRHVALVQLPSRTSCTYQMHPLTGAVAVLFRDVECPQRGHLLTELSLQHPPPWGRKEAVPHRVQQDLVNRSCGEAEGVTEERHLIVQRRAEER